MMQALPALRFQLHPDDHERYGSEWYVYDESAIARMPVREQLAVEREIEAVYGYGLLAMVDRMRRDMLDARLVASWLARRLAGVTESLADYEPMISLMSAEAVPQEPAGDDADPPAVASDSSESTDPSSESSTPTSPGSRSARKSRHTG